MFLFDEPASNLHSSAQAQLLKSFGRFPPESTIVYTTHSHHLINPAWLEGSYVVKNEALDYDVDDDNYTAQNTVITLEKYRSFASNHPDQSTYFQPILDVLDYSPGQLENVPNVVMLEGKNDFYTLKYFQDIVLKRKDSLNLMPGGGAGHLDNAIRLYLAWGRNFVVILDGDTAGKDEKKRYHELFGLLVAERIFTLEDIDATWKKARMESLVEPSDQMAIQTAVYTTTAKFNKTHFNRAIQELYVTGKKLPVSPKTIANIERILDFCKRHLGT